MSTTTPSRAATEALAEIAIAITQDDITDDARAAARLCVLDLIGCAVAGFDEAPAQATRRWALETQAGGSSSIWLGGKTSSALGAATVNAAAGSACDGDDAHWGAILHAGASLVPAAFAAAEATDSSGAELVDALVVGYEVACRIGSGVDWDALGQMATGSWIGWGAAAIAARLRGASAAELAEAFNVAGALKPVVLPPGVTTNRNGVKEGIPWATFAGLAAEQLASYGLTGPPECLDNDLLDRDRILVPPTGRFEVEDVEFKPYACCAWTHGAVDALLSLTSEHGLGASEIERIGVTLYSDPVNMLYHDTDPKTVQSAQYSIPYVLAIAAHEGAAGLLPLSSDLLGRGDLIDLASRVDIRASTEYDAALPERRPARVQLDTARGTFDREVDRETTPSSLETLSTKLRTMTRGAWTDARQTQVIAAVEALSESEVEPLATLLRAVPDVSGT